MEAYLRQNYLKLLANKLCPLVAVLDDDVGGEADEAVDDDIFDQFIKVLINQADLYKCAADMNW